ncbi:hypothetical protein F2Q69_00014623 [Brassica cretica]|uniref:Uncharacterized protein n=1 Tax=Brassica cretica TaxID=69181 RepID=A0A8S9QWF2_BRACR|nr:hypothetical protein F2Q69_00014623 [Brassica cretica]
MKEVRHLIFFNPSPASIVFISNPECVRYFRYQMMCLSTCEYNILLAYEYAHDFAPAHFLWKTLLEDAKMDYVGKAKLRRNSQVNLTIFFAQHATFTVKAAPSLKMTI